MAWDKWLKDENEEPKYPQIGSVDENAEYANPELASLHNGLFGFLGSFPKFGAQWAHEMGRPLYPNQGIIGDKAPQRGIMTKQSEQKPIENSFAPQFHTLEEGMLNAANSLPKDWVPNQEVGAVRGFADTVLENAPQMVGQAALAAISPTLSAGMMAASISGDTYGDLLEKGVDADTASKYALANTLIQTPLEYTGMEKWLKLGGKAKEIMAKRGLSKAIGGAMAGEGITEAIQEIPDEMTRYIAEHGNLDGFDYGQLGLNAVEAGAVGAFYGGLFGGVNYKLNKDRENALEKALNETQEASEDNKQNVGTDNTAQQNGGADNPAMYIMGRLTNAGLDPQTASGIVGGLMTESGGNTVDISPTAENPSGAYGIAQWLGERREALNAFAKSQGKDQSDLDTQIDFLIHEIQNGEAGSLEKIRGAKSPEEAGILADQWYERSEGTDDIRSAKSKNARAIYDAFTNGNGSARTNRAKNESNPKSANDFLKDIEAQMPLTTEEDWKANDHVNDIIKNGSKEQQEELAEQYGWVKNEENGTSGSPTKSAQENTQETATNVPKAKISNPTSTNVKQEKVKPKDVTIKTKNLDKLQKFRVMPVDTPNHAGAGKGNNNAIPNLKLTEGGTSNVYGKQVQTANPQAPTYQVGGADGSTNTNRLPTTTPSGFYEGKPVNGIADRQRRDSDIAGARNRQVGVKVGEDMIDRGIRNSNLKKLVKQAFVDGDKQAMDRLSALKLNPQVLSAVRQEVDPTYRKVAPVEKTGEYKPKGMNTEQGRNEHLRTVGSNLNWLEGTSQYEARETKHGDNSNKSIAVDYQQGYTGRVPIIDGKNASNGNESHGTGTKVDSQKVLKKARQKHIDHLKELITKAYIGGDKDAMRRLSALRINQDIIDSILQDVYPSYANGSTSNEKPVTGVKYIPPVTSKEDVVKHGQQTNDNENSYTTVKVKKNKDAEKKLKSEFNEAKAKKKAVEEKEKTNETTKNNTEVRELLHSTKEDKGTDAEPKQSSQQESKPSQTSEEKPSVKKEEPKKEEPKQEQPKQEKPKEEPQKQTGKSVTVRTDDGQEFTATYKIMPVSEVVSSNTWDFGKNENYPEELQPRDRDRVTMREQVDGMARDLNPSDLAESRNINEGSPLINADNVVENGNGRTMAIARAYNHGGEAYKASADAYKQFLIDNAEKFGYTKEQVQAMENPILVRQRDNTSDNLQDAIIHSTNGGMKMGAVQQAQADAEKITPSTLKKYNYDGKGDLTQAVNRDFVVSAINEIASKNERDSLFDKDGNPSAEGVKRVQNAMVALAYDNDELLTRIGESIDPEDLNIANALKATAPRVASIKLRIDSNDIPHGYDLPQIISDAVEFYYNCKAEGKKVSLAMNETALFEGEDVSEDAKKLAKFFEENNRKPNVIANAINDMVERIDANAEPSMSLIEGGNMDMSEIMNTSMYPNNDLFAPQKSPTVQKASDDMQNVVDKYKEGKGNKPTAVKAIDAIEKKAVQEAKKDNKKEDITDIKEAAKDAKTELAEAKRGEPQTDAKSAKQESTDSDLPTYEGMIDEVDSLYYHSDWVANETVEDEEGNVISEPTKEDVWDGLVDAFEDEGHDIDWKNPYNGNKLNKKIFNAEKKRLAGKAKPTVAKNETVEKDFQAPFDISDEAEAQVEKDLARVFGNVSESNGKKATGKKANKESTAKEAENLNAEDEVNITDEVDSSDAELERVKKQLADALNKVTRRTNLFGVFDPDIWIPAFHLGAIYASRGAKSFAKFSKQIISDFGDNIKPWTKSVWEALKLYPKGVKLSDEQMGTAIRFAGTKYFKAQAKGVPYTLDNLNADFKRFAGEANYKKYKKLLPSVYAAVSTYQAENGTKKATEPVETHDNEKISGTIDTDTSTVVESKGENDNVPGRKRSTGGTVEMAGRGQSEQNGAGDGEVTGNDSEGKDRVSGPTHGGYTGSSEQADTGAVQGQRNGNETTNGVEQNDGAGNEAGRTEKPVISPKVDKIEKDIENKKTKNARDIPGNDFVLKEDSKELKGTARVKANIEAIKLAKKIKDEGRKATPSEQEILASYSGWGGLSSYLTPSSQNYDAKVVEDLKATVGDDAFRNIEQEAITAYYTPIPVIKAMWKLAERLGFKGGRILDPSCGTARFFGAMPNDMRANSRTLQGVELSELPAEIASQLYQSRKFNIAHEDFRDFKASDGFYDLAITNVPFSADIKIADKKVDGGNKYALHNYFFAKSLDKVRPGGLVIFMTSSNTLDTAGDSAKLRRMLAGKAELLGAIRLPTDTFKGAGANVVTDIIAFRKLNEGETMKADTWKDVTGEIIDGNYVESDIGPSGYVDEKGKVRTIDGKTVTGYYGKHKQNLIGEYKHESSQYGDTVVVRAKDGQDVIADLNKAIDTFPKDVYQPRQTTPINSLEHVEQIRLAENGENEGDLVKLDDGTIAKVESVNGELKAVPMGANYKRESDRKKRQSLAKDFVAVRDALNDVFEAQVNPDLSEEAVEKKRAVLRNAYHDFVKKHGYLNDKKNYGPFADTPLVGRVLALEKYKAAKKKDEAPTVEEAGILTKRTRYPGGGGIVNISTAGDAFLSSLEKFGHIDMDYMAQTLGMSKDDIAKQLEGKIIKDPVKEQYVPLDEYLSGNVRQKLEMAETAARSDPTYLDNVEKLKAVIPKDITLKDIDVSLGSPILGLDTVQQFVDDLVGGKGFIKIGYNPTLSSWYVEKGDDYGKIAKNIADKYSIDSIGEGKGESGVPVYKVIQDMLNGTSSVGQGTMKEKADDTPQMRQAREDARQKLRTIYEQINKELKKWIGANPSIKKEVETNYNNRFNATVGRKFDGSFLTFEPWFNKEINVKLRPHQKNAIWRTLTNRGVLYAHCVGTGKTWTMQASGMELRRLGLAHKVAYAVPNNVVKQFHDELIEIAPEAKVLVVNSESIPEAPKTLNYDYILQKEAKPTKENDYNLVDKIDAQGMRVYEKVPVPRTEAERNNLLKQALAKAKKANAPQVLIDYITDRYSEKNMKLRSEREAQIAKRAAAISKIATNDWDAIIFSHQSFERLPVAKEHLEEFYKSELAKYEQALREEQATNGKNSQGAKDIQKQLLNFKEKLRDLIERTERFGAMEEFRTIGIDQLFVDEADNFKNLPFMTKMNRVKGISEGASSRALDMFIKTQYLMKSPNAHGVVFATGTPISNSVVDLYTMCRYLASDKLEALGINTFDQFAKMFITVANRATPKTDGTGYEYKQSVTGLKNAPECIELFRSFADVINIEDAPEVLEKRPVVKRVTVSVGETSWLSKFKRSIRDRAAAIKAAGKKNPVMIDSRSKESIEMFEKTGHYKKVRDSGLLLANDYKQATVSPKLIENGLKDVESKVRACADAIYKEYVNSNDIKGTQAVFCDIGTPGTKKTDSAYTVYDELKALLVAKGIPANEIDFSQNYDGEKKKKMSDAVNAGTIRVIIGSTQQMGAGTNMQKRMVALHHLDVPWRPRDIEQREGRAIRQGNINKEVQIYNYVQEGSYDMNLWNMIAAKANVIAAIMHGDKSVRTIETEGVDSNNWQELESMSNNDPVQKRFMEVQAEIGQLESEKRIWKSQKEQNEAIRVNNPQEIEKVKALISDIEEDIKIISQTDPKKFSMKIGNKTYDKRETANKALTDEKTETAYLSAQFVHKNGKTERIKPVTVGSVRGMNIVLDCNTPTFKNILDSAHVDVNIKGKQSYKVATPTSDGIWKALQYIPNQTLEDKKKTLASLEGELKEASKPMSDTFEGEKELTDLKEELKSLQKQMDENAAKQREEDRLAKEAEMQEDTASYLISDADSVVRQSPKEMQEQVMRSFPNASNVVTSGSTMEFDLPNGEHMKVNFTDDTISYNAEKAQADYGGKLTGNEKALGSMETTSREAIMTLTMDNVAEAPSHEAMHFAMNFLSERERSALYKTYGNEEAICEAYRHWQIERQNKRGTLLGKIHQKIADVVNKILSVFRENDKNVFRKVQDGQMWTRERDNKSAHKVSYLMNPKNQIEKYLKNFSKSDSKANSRDYISIKNRPQEKGWTVTETLGNNIFSPSRSTDPVQKRLHSYADDAIRTMQKKRTDWTEKHTLALKRLKTEKQKQQYSALLFQEDAEKHAYTDAELREAGYDENIITAHRMARNLLGTMYNDINDVYTNSAPVTKSYVKLSDAKKRVAEAEKSPYETVIGKIQPITVNGKTRYQVTVKMPHAVKHEDVITAKELEELKADKFNVINASTKLKNGKYVVSYTSYAKPLTNMEGYMPHFFHDFMIIRREKGADGEMVAKVVGSATTQDKAVEIADKLHEKSGGEYLIAPKAFQFEGETENPVLMGDNDYHKLLKNIEQNSTLTLEQAKKLTNARKKGRHVFLGELKKRTGAEGFETNAIWAVQHHIDASARYVALDPFKRKATNLFERAYGDMNKDYGRTSKQAFAKGYIDSMLGKPSEAEQIANKILRHVPAFKNMSRPGRFVAGTLTHLTGLLKLGASPAAGFVNLMQIFNAVGYLGARATAVGMKRAIRLNQADLRLLKSLGVDDEVGLAMDSPYGKIRLEETNLTRATDRYTAIADKLMLPFTIAERTIRRATTLAAYYSYLNSHKGDNTVYTKNKAKEYALDINRKVNFDYSVADAPRIFRAVEGSVLGDIALQFQKYGIKELEVIKDFMPYLGRDTTTKQKLEFFGAYLAMAGLWNAAPFEDALLALLGSIFGIDPEKVAKKAMMEWAGNDPTSQAIVNVANYGAGALVGADISQRIGLKGAIPETDNLLQGGPLGSTAIGIARAILNSDTNGALKSLSPAIGNIYGATIGYNTDSKGRKTVEYDNWDRAMRALGFRTVREAAATDVQSIVYNYKEQKKNDRAKAKEEYLDNPSSENRRKLKGLGYSDSQIKALKDNKNTTKADRARTGLSKSDQKELAPILDYMKYMQ